MQGSFFLSAHVRFNSESERTDDMENVNKGKLNA
jgi:hypothetical protein